MNSNGMSKMMVQKNAYYYIEKYIDEQERTDRITAIEAVMLKKKFQSVLKTPYGSILSEFIGFLVDEIRKEVRENAETGKTK